MIPYRAMAVMLILVAGTTTATLVACDTPDPTQAVVENAYPALVDGGDPATRAVVYRAWFVTTLFKEAVLPGEASDEERSVPENDFVYVLLAPGWDPESGTPPAKLIALKSKAKLRAVRGDTLHITVSDRTFAGSCDGRQPLSQEDADFITTRIFPGDFANVTYDAKTCTTTPVPTDDAGVDAGIEGDAEAGPDARTD